MFIYNYSDKAPSALGAPPKGVIVTKGYQQLSADTLSRLISKLKKLGIGAGATVATEDPNWIVQTASSGEPETDPLKSTAFALDLLGSYNWPVLATAANVQAFLADASPFVYAYPIPAATNQIYKMDVRQRDATLLSMAPADGEYVYINTSADKPSAMAQASSSDMNIVPWVIGGAAVLGFAMAMRKRPAAF